MIGRRSPHDLPWCASEIGHSGKNDHRMTDLKFTDSISRYYIAYRAYLNIEVLWFGDTVTMLHLTKCNYKLKSVSHINLVNFSTIFHILSCRALSTWHRALIHMPKTQTWLHFSLIVMPWKTTDVIPNNPNPNYNISSYLKHKKFI